MTTVRRWTGSDWEDALALPGNMLTTDTAQTISGLKTFSTAPVVPDGSFSIAKTTGLQTALDSKYSAANPPPGGSVDLSNYVYVDGASQVITGNKVFQMSTIPGVSFVGGPAGSPGSIAAVSMARQGGTVDAWFGVPNTTKFFSDDQPGDFSIRANTATGAIRLGYGTNNTGSSMLTISAGGVVVNGTAWAGAFGTTGYSGTSTKFGVLGLSATQVTSVIKAAPSQTASMTEWQNSTGLVQARMAYGGTLYARNAGLTATAATDTQLGLTGFAAQSTVSAYIKLGAGQTGNALEVQTSAGAVLSRIGPDGAIYDNGNRVYSASNPPPGGGGGTTDLSNYVTLNGAETLTGAKTFSALLTTTGIAATGTVATPLINGYSSVISITPATDAQDGLLIKVPTATYGTGVAYGEGQPIQVLTDGAGTGQAMVRFRVDRYGGIGTTGGMHIAPGQNSSTYVPTQGLWIQPQVNGVIPQITDGWGDTDIAWFRNQAVLVNSAPKTLLKIKANGVTEVSENVQAGTAYPGIQQVTVGSVFGVAGVYFGSDALLYRPAAVSELRSSHTIRSDVTLIGTTGVFDGANRVYSASNPPPAYGKELGYAERNTNDTTTNTVLNDTTLNSNLISGLSVTVTGTGTPVEIEVYIPSMSSNSAAAKTYALIMVNGTQASYAGATSAAAGQPTTGIAKRRMILTDGVSYTFTVGKFVTAGTGTYTASATAAMYISVVQR